MDKSVKIKITLASITLTLSSCATKIPENTLNEYAQNYTAIMLCSSYVSEYKINQVRDMLTYNLHSWDYDSEELDGKIRGYYQGYSKDKVNSETCNQYIDVVHSNLEVEYNQRVEQERIIRQNMNATAQIFSQVGSSVNAAGSNTLATMQSATMSPRLPVQAETKGNILYESRPNPMNKVNGQTLVDSDISVTGRKVCIYSDGATKVLPYGSIICPSIFSE